MRWWCCKASCRYPAIAEFRQQSKQSVDIAKESAHSDTVLSIHATDGDQGDALNYSMRRPCMKLGARVSIKLVTGLSLALGCVSPAFAGATTVAVVATPVPTLDEFGLIGLGAVIGVAGLITLLRRKK